MFSDLFGLALFVLFCYIMIYAVVDRICKCCEDCARSKSFGQIAASGVDLDALAKKIKEKV